MAEIPSSRSPPSPARQPSQNSAWVLSSGVTARAATSCQIVRASSSGVSPKYAEKGIQKSASITKRSLPARRACSAAARIEVPTKLMFPPRLAACDRSRHARARPTSSASSVRPSSPVCASLVASSADPRWFASWIHPRSMRPRHSCNRSPPTVQSSIRSARTFSASSKSISASASAKSSRRSVLRTSSVGRTTRERRSRPAAAGMSARANARRPAAASRAPARLPSSRPRWSSGPSSLR